MFDTEPVEGEDLDLVTEIVRFEGGEMDDDEVLRFFQYLVDTGLAWTLQGFYGRAASGLIQEGLISEA